VIINPGKEAIEDSEKLTPRQEEEQEKKKDLFAQVRKSQVSVDASPPQKLNS
jgi:hypothetical protein